MTLKTCERDPNDIKIAIFFQKKSKKITQRRPPDPRL